MEHKHESDSDGGMKSRSNITLIVFLIIGAFFLITEHRAHLVGWLSSYWIWLLLLACPLMHLFMHGGHDHGDHGSSGASNESTEEKK